MENKVPSQDKLYRAGHCLVAKSMKICVATLTKDLPLIALDAMLGLS
jgi:hypothetical protein